MSQAGTYFARRGARLGLVARRKEMLEALAAELRAAGAAEVLVEAVDVTNHAAQRAAFERFETHFAGGITHLILNAGISGRAEPWTDSWETVKQCLDVNLMAAVNAAVFVDGQADPVGKAARNVLSGLAGGFVGATLMALGIALLPAGPRNIAAWLPMLATGTVAGALLALDNALDLDLISVLYPVWQAGVATTLALALRRPKLS